MQFGVFDHMDDAGIPLGEQYEARLRLIEAYDRAGFHAYHLAEHHATPLGMAPAPSVFLAAVAQRTRRLRFGPLVYTLALHHPLRLAEEICMLDHLSGGRLEVGVGRGISAFELGYFGVDAAQAPGMYREALAVVLQALRGPSVSFAGEHFRFTDVPIEMQPVQRPHPPLWYGVSRADSLDWPAAHGVNVVTNTPAERARPITERYRALWQAAGKSEATLPLLGMSRHIVIADSDEAALAAARRAYARWYASFMKLWIKHNATPPNAPYPATLEALQAMGLGIVGSPDTVREILTRQVREAGITYLCCRFAFGDLTLAESTRSLELFVREIMPAFQATRAH
ncbi:MAG: LLM class flavin-dependent oxidoreductase [Alphaproteobacteria bacterium]|nr:LLM class flavin-dependent oxidoreductase [Alphaproteobacteria bacterium]